MSKQFSIQSIEFIAEKYSNCRYLCDESLAHLTVQTSEIIFDLLKVASKYVSKSRRNFMTRDDFSLALKSYNIEPMYGNLTISIENSVSFHRIKKDHRNLYVIDDNVISLNKLINSQSKVPFDISIRSHWLAINGKQPISNENPSTGKSHQLRKHTDRPKKLNPISHILSIEQEIFFKELTQTCIDSNEQKRKACLLILSSDLTILQIIERLAIFIYEGVRINISISDKSMTLIYLIDMINALLQNEELSLERYLHYLFPSVISCLLHRTDSYENWPLRDLAAICCGHIIRKYSSATNRLQQRTIDIFYRILINKHDEYTWPTLYGAFIGLCEMGNKIIVQIIFPLVKQLGDQIRLLNDTELSRRLTEVIVKFITKAYRSAENEYDNVNRLQENFGSYFAPLVQHKLILLL